MEIKEMTIEQLEERKVAISSEVEMDGADLDALDAEVKSINAELEERRAVEAKKVEVRQAIADGAGKVIESAPIEEREEMKDIAEVRNSKEYIDAYAEYLKTGNVEEMRSAKLLSQRKLK